MISPWSNTPHCAEAQRFYPSALSSLEMECGCRVQVECGREEVNDGEKQEKDKHEETDNEHSCTHHGWHEDGMKRAQRHIGWLVLSHAV